MKSSIADKVIPSLALKMGKKSAASCCIWWIHQPKVPTGMREMVKKGSEEK